MGTVLIGTSGWSYGSWKGDFYPTGLPSRRFLEFYAERFGTTEVNSTFYRVPLTSTFETWSAQVPENFVFTLKATRLITHVGRLADIDEAWAMLVRHAAVLGRHLGPILLQFPPSFRCDPPALARFLRHARRPAPRGARLRLALEFRHASWFNEDIYALLRRWGAALCIADSPQYPRHDVVTADFVYIRFHGRTKLFASNYSNPELADEAVGIRRYLRHGLDVYAYFNNDAQGHAVRNAATLRRMVQRPEGR